MDILKVSSVVFSPTGATEKTCQTIAKGLPYKNEVFDITPLEARKKSLTFDKNQLVIIGVPVYGGRVPAPAALTISKMKGDHTPAVLIATYGNRDYDDTLLELKSIITKNGFTVVAAATFVTEHSIMHSVAPGRPDLRDMEKMQDLASLLREKLQKYTDITKMPEVFVKGNLPFKTYAGIPLKPQTSKLCNRCGECAKGCPVGAISKSDPRKTNKELCISCMRCVKVCPSKARSVNKLLLSVAESSFHKKYNTRRYPELFI
ncbi:MAG: EFR1 family ferrodoxin [Clostridia bacterium]